MNHKPACIDFYQFFYSHYHISFGIFHDWKETSWMWDTCFVCRLWGNADEFNHSEDVGLIQWEWARRKNGGTEEMEYFRSLNTRMQHNVCVCLRSYLQFTIIALQSILICILCWFPEEKKRFEIEMKQNRNGKTCKCFGNMLEYFVSVMFYTCLKHTELSENHGTKKNVHGRI